MIHPRVLTVVSVFAGCIALNAEAADSVADFNDLAPGGINTKSGGSGWTGSWSGSAGGTIVSGNLTSSRYSLGQTGTTQHYFNSNGTGLRQNYRTLAAPITGEFWFSYLALTPNTATGAGLSFNPATGTPFDNPGSAYLQFLGSDLVYRFGDATSVTLANQISLNSTALVIGQIIVNGGGLADSIKLWVNPDLVATPSIFSHTPAISSSAFNFADSITHIGLIAYGDSTSGGHIDALRISDGGGNQQVAIQTVTGVPEPATAVLLGTGLMVLAGRRRRA